MIMCTPESDTSGLAVEKISGYSFIRRDNGVNIQHGRRQHASWSSERYCDFVKNIVTKLAERYGKIRQL